MIRAILATTVVCVSAVAGAFAAPTAPGETTADCARTSTGLVPLKDLGAEGYKGFGGGLYPGGANAPTGRYLAQGSAAARGVVPRVAGGKPDPDGRIVLLSIGMSNTTQEFQAFTRSAAADATTSPRMLLVDGAQGGQDAQRIADPSAPFWARVDERLARAGATARQVQVVWLKQAIARETRSFPADARGLQASLRSIVSIMRARYANLKLVFLSSRTYAGYATTSLNPEPYAYQSAFAVRWLIGERMAGKVVGPWLGWGPYLWTDGTKGRRDGLQWTCGDVREDGTHPSPSGQAKVAGLLLRFFKASSTSQSWFRVA
ncbi:MAG TPA: hypothetical protein VMK83_02285 [Gaiellaceae bacterium]|nr:hypothetical protein [Gaiellaceae bacterium]